MHNGALAVLGEEGGGHWLYWGRRAVCRVVSEEMEDEKELCG